MFSQIKKNNLQRILILKDQSVNYYFDVSTEEKLYAVALKVILRHFKKARYYALEKPRNIDGFLAWRILNFCHDCDCIKFNFAYLEKP